MRRLLLLVPVVLLAAACGGTSKPRLFLPGPTADCLRQHGFTVSTKDADVPLVARLADHGGLRASPKAKDNTLVVAFSAGLPAARQEFRAISRVAPPRLRLHFRDVALIARNAVLVWTVAPKATDQQAVLDCLSG